MERKNKPQHNQPIGHNVCNPEVECLQRILLDKILENHDRLVESAIIPPQGINNKVKRAQREKKPYILLTTLPAKPPANSANPKNKTNRAFQATPLPL